MLEAALCAIAVQAEILASPDGLLAALMAQNLQNAQLEEQHRTMSKLERAAGHNATNGTAFQYTNLRSSRCARTLAGSEVDHTAGPTMYTLT